MTRDSLLFFVDTVVLYITVTIFFSKLYYKKLKISILNYQTIFD
jgi:hypothetical protein